MGLNFFLLKKRRKKGGNRSIINKCYYYSEYNLKEKEKKKKRNRNIINKCYYYIDLKKKLNWDRRIINKFYYFINPFSSGRKQSSAPGSGTVRRSHRHHVHSHPVGAGLPPASPARPGKLLPGNRRRRGQRPTTQHRGQSGNDVHGGHHHGDAALFGHLSPGFPALRVT